MKKCLRNLCLFLVLGAIVNVAAAWGCALWVDLSTVQSTGGKMYDSANHVEWTAWVLRSPGAAFVQSVRSRTDHEGATFVDPTIKLVPAIGGIRAAGQSFETRGYEDRYIEAEGWPLLCLWSEYRPSSENSLLVGEPDLEPDGAYRIAGPPRERRWHLVPVSIPTWVFWPGFAIDAIFYATILWLLFISPSKVRRFIRIRRGRCGACGYPIGASGRPVKGHIVPRIDE
jgi:hypothetical protein